MTAELGHHPSRVYIDESGNLHLNGASVFDVNEVDLTANLNAVVPVASVAGTAEASKVPVLGAGKNLDVLTLATLTDTKETAGVGASTAAAGNAVGNAGALPAGTAKVYPTTGADDTKGVVIDVADQVTGRVLFIGNGVSNKILKVYGPSGAVINGAAADAAFSSVSGKGVIAVCLSGAGNTWLMW